MDDEARHAVLSYEDAALRVLAGVAHVDAHPFEAGHIIQQRQLVVEFRREGQADGVGTRRYRRLAKDFLLGGDRLRREVAVSGINLGIRDKGLGMRFLEPQVSLMGTDFH